MDLVNPVTSRRIISEINSSIPPLIAVHQISGLGRRISHENRPSVEDAAPIAGHLTPTTRSRPVSLMRDSFSDRSSSGTPPTSDPSRYSNSIADAEPVQFLASFVSVETHLMPHGCGHEATGASPRFILAVVSTKPAECRETRKATRLREQIAIANGGFRPAFALYQEAALEQDLLREFGNRRSDSHAIDGDDDISE